MKNIIMTLVFILVSAYCTKEALAETKSHTITYPGGKQVTYRWGK